MLPIRLSQSPRFFKQAIKRSLVLRRPRGAPCTFHLCYFSCQSYFKYLYCSLHSLVKHGGDIAYKILVFSDEEQPLSEAQINAIHMLIPRARVITWPKSMGWGATQIGWIWRAYEIAAADASENDVIARIDSDVFFFNDNIFRVVQRSNADMVGDGHYVNFKYCQGGCYFLRVPAVRKICELISVKSVDELLKGVETVVEDIAACHFAKHLGLRIWQVWFMMFPDELKNAGGLTPWMRWKFSCVHFVMKNKSAMLVAYEKEVLKGADPEGYQQALSIP